MTKCDGQNSLSRISFTSRYSDCNKVPTVLKSLNPFSHHWFARENSKNFLGAGQIL